MQKAVKCAKRVNNKSDMFMTKDKINLRKTDMKIHLLLCIWNKSLERVSSEELRINIATREKCFAL